MFKSYKIFGRKKGKKKITYNYKNFYKDYFINLKKNFSDFKIIIDIGSGTGENAIYLSKIFPKKLIIACEVYEDGIISMCKKIKKDNISNLKIYDNNIELLLDNFDFKKKIDEFWILFPDPWPKKKHQKRRLINENFLCKISRLIRNTGKLYIASDSKSYILSILLTVSKMKNFTWLNNLPYKWQYSSQNTIETKYYKKALKNDRKSIILIFQKHST